MCIGENFWNIREKKFKMYEDKSNVDCCFVNIYLVYKEYWFISMMIDEFFLVSGVIMVVISFVCFVFFVYLCWF